MSNDDKFKWPDWVKVGTVAGALLTLLGLYDWLVTPSQELTAYVSFGPYVPPPGTWEHGEPRTGQFYLVRVRNTGSKGVTMVKVTVPYDAPTIVLLPGHRSYGKDDQSVDIGTLQAREQAKVGFWYDGPALPGDVVRDISVSHSDDEAEFVVSEPALDITFWTTYSVGTFVFALLFLSIGAILLLKYIEVLRAKAIPDGELEAIKAREQKALQELAHAKSAHEAATRKITKALSEAADRALESTGKWDQENRTIADLRKREEAARQRALVAETKLAKAEEANAFDKEHARRRAEHAAEKDSAQPIRFDGLEAGVASILVEAVSKKRYSGINPSFKIDDLKAGLEIVSKGWGALDGLVITVFVDRLPPDMVALMGIVAKRRG